MALAYGLSVFVTSHEQYEQLLVHPESISGWYDPAVQHGQVLFASKTAAEEARRTLH